MSGVDNLAFDSGEQREFSQPERNLSDLKNRNSIVDSQKESFTESEHLKCGWLWFRPKSLQFFRTPKWALFWLCWCAALQGMIVNGFVNVVITTIEKRFDLKSSQTGLIAGGYDIASFLLLIPISYLGGRPIASKPRYIGLGVLVLGLGSLLFASPHFIADSYKATVREENVCYMSLNSTDMEVCNSEDAEKDQINSNLYLAIFLIAQFLHGIGSTPFFTLGVTYLDENISRKMSSVYIGIYYTMAIIGPASGYVIGGKLLDIYTEFITTDVTSLGLTPDSNLWIGAWWIGFVIAALFCVLIAIPLLAFPASLPGSSELAKERISEAHQSSSSSTVTFSKIHELPQAFTTLMRNPAFFMLNLAGASDGLLIAGFAAFLPKLIENQFSVTASNAAFLMGLVTVPAGGGGTFIGGYLIKKLNLPCKGILKFCMLATALCIIFSFCFALSCPNIDFAGLNIPYSNSEKMTLDDPCNADCGCSKYQFNPICGVDNVMYYSPCYAGCLKEISLNDVKIYSECKCVNATALKMMNSTSGNDVSYSGINTTCDTSCNYIWPFIIMMFFNMFFTFVCTMPALSATLRVVKDEERSFALGIQWIKARILGTIPAPILFGAIIDQTCILWHETCEGRGACLVYDNYYMNKYMLALGTVGKVATLIFYTLAWKYYKPPKENVIINISLIR